MRIATVAWLLVWCGCDRQPLPSDTSAKRNASVRVGPAAPGELWERASELRRRIRKYQLAGQTFQAAPLQRELAALPNASMEEMIDALIVAEPFQLPAFLDSDSTAAGQPAFTPADVLAVRMYVAEGFWQEASQAIDVLASGFPDSQPVHALRDLVRAANSGREPKSDQEHPDVWTAKAIVADQRDDVDSVIGYCVKVLRVDPSHRVAHRLLASAARSSGRTDASACVAARLRTLDQIVNRRNAWREQPITAADAIRIADRLSSLGRHPESRRWRTIAGAEASSSSKSVSSAGRTVEEDFLCGLDAKFSPTPTPTSSATATADASVAAEPVSTSRLPIRLVDRAAAVGLRFSYDNGDRDRSDDRWLLHEMTGGGIGVLDYDLDGWCDLYFAQGGGPPFEQNACLPNRLIHNVGGDDVRDVTVPAQAGDRGYGQGIAVCDWNQDGFPDLVVANLGPNRWLRNRGDGTFVAEPVGESVAGNAWTSSLIAADFNGDRSIDFYECNYIDDLPALETPCVPGSSVCAPSNFRAAADRFLTSEPDGQWTAAVTSGVDPCYGFAGLATDFDGNGTVELFVANDVSQNFFWVLDRDAQLSERATDVSAILREQATLRGCGFGVAGETLGCMGIAAGDFNRDGRIDLHVTNYFDQPSNLYRQGKAMQFTDVAAPLGLRTATLPDVGFGTQAVDLDHDGHEDLVTLNGHIIDRRHDDIRFRMKPSVYRGGRSRFVLSEAKPGDLEGQYWERATLGRCLAKLDWNRDGRMDLIANHLDRPAALLINETPTGPSRFIRFRLVGVDTERDAVGARVSVDDGESTMHRWVTAGDGFLSSNEAALHFGLGGESATVNVSVDWPSGTRQRFDAMEIGKEYLVVENQESVVIIGH